MNTLYLSPSQKRHQQELKNPEKVLHTKATVSDCHTYHSIFHRKESVSYLDTSLGEWVKFLLCYRYFSSDLSSFSLLVTDHCFKYASIHTSSAELEIEGIFGNNNDIKRLKRLQNHLFLCIILLSSNLFQVQAHIFFQCSFFIKFLFGK